MSEPLFLIVYPDDDEVDISKSDKQLFEEALAGDQKAVELFSSWDESKGAYSNIHLDHKFRHFSHYMVMTRVIINLRGKVYGI